MGHQAGSNQLGGARAVDNVSPVPSMLAAHVGKKWEPLTARRMPSWAPQQCPESPRNRLNQPPRRLAGQGYNRRATVLFLLGRYQESIEDCQLVLELNPYHFGAASGMGMCYRCERVMEGRMMSS